MAQVCGLSREVVPQLLVPATAIHQQLGAILEGEWQTNHVPGPPLVCGGGHAAVSDFTNTFKLFVEEEYKVG